MDFAAPPFLKRVDIDKTIKEEFHKLVPYKNSGFGEKQSIYTTRNYTFDAVDLEELLLDDLSVSADNGVIGISFNKFNGIDYVVYLNGGQCLSLNNGFYAPKQRFPIGKLEIYCKKDERILWKTKRLVRLF